MADDAQGRSHRCWPSDPEPTLRLVILERLAIWAPRLREPLSHQVWICESRNSTDVRDHLRGACCAIVLIDLTACGEEGLEVIAQLHHWCPDAWSLALGSERTTDLLDQARWHGVTSAHSDLIPTEALIAILRRWSIRLVDRMAKRGWSRPAKPPRPWWLEIAHADPLDLVSRALEDVARAR